MDYFALATAKLQERAGIFEQRKAVMENATFTDADKQLRTTAMDADMALLEAEARSLVSQGEAENELRSLTDRAAALGGPRAESRGTARDEAAELRGLAKGSIKELDFDFRTAQSGVAGNAGNTKQTTFAAQVLEAMRLRSEFFNRAFVMNTSGGETIEWPIKNALNPATAPVSNAALTAENVAYAKGDQAWTKTSIGAYKYGVIVEATSEIVTDSELPILDILAADAGESVADVVVSDLLIGNGTSKPWGWITRASGAVNAASLSAVTFDNLMDLQYSLTVPYRRNGVYMFNDTAIATLRKIKDTTGRYLWEPSLVAGAPDTILGKPAITDPTVAIAGAGAKVGVFGDPKKYMIRQVKNLRVTRSDEYGFDRDVVAFKVSWRGSGDLFDLNSVKALTVTA